jgi:hypothetical protein
MRDPAFICFKSVSLLLGRALSPALLLAIGCSSAVVPVPTPTDTSASQTGDTATDSQWDRVDDRHAPERYEYVDVAWLDAPNAVFVHVSGAYEVDDHDRGGSNTRFKTWSTPTAIPEELDSFGPANGGGGWGQSVRVEAVGDVTGDGADDVASQMGRLYVRSLNGGTSLQQAPVDWLEGTTGDPVTDVQFTGFQAVACDANRDGQPDLCTSRGFDLGPIDDTPEATWTPGVPFFDETIAVGRTGDTTTAWVARPGGVTAIDLGVATGEVDLDALPVWETPDTDVVFALAAVPMPDGDLLAVCSGFSDATLRVLDGLADSPPILTVPRRCLDLEVGDYDGDGQPEIAVASQSAIEIVELDGTVRNTLVGDIEPGNDLLGAGMDSADVNGDGRDDLIATAPGSGALYITFRVIDDP